MKTQKLSPLAQLDQRITEHDPPILRFIATLRATVMHRSSARALIELTKEPSTELQSVLAVAGWTTSKINDGQSDHNQGNLF
jgi:hypothetical protein